MSTSLSKGLIRLTETIQQDGKSEWAAIQSASEKLGPTPESLLRWIRQHQRDQGTREGLYCDDQARLKALEKENKELWRSNEILKTASAFFAQAELVARLCLRGLRDRRLRTPHC